MEITDVITFTIGVSLGLISIVLGVFAIWFSHKLSESSSAALESVKDLARETKILVDASLSQQKDFSTKMLDSILQQNKFGSTGVERPAENLMDSTSAFTTEVAKILEIFEQNISDSIERTVKSYGVSNPDGQVELKEALAAIKSDIGKLSQAAPVISSVVAESEVLRQSLQSFREHPAHYLVLSGVINGGMTDYEDKQQVAKEYSFPNGWEDGIENLINKGVLESTGDGGFQVPDAYKGYLEEWVQRNNLQLTRLRTLYKRKKSRGAPTAAEVLVGDQFEH